ncbi:anti-sigma factor domain-containing protein [Thalassospira lucentensis]|uniref:anti-sigma factor n=1 Tax=Thalassospira lucentensis TaxID=168935 RepID=UPI002943CCDE|nr:anti-sigma factor [Thalassospira lucentensis]WOI09711.1 anti-sigma factor [Thalassospira lucentensis]
MTDREDIDMLAAEYVLGTLDPDMRRIVDERRSHEDDLNAAIADWEKRLSPLNAHYRDEIPSRDLFPGIRARIEEARVQADNIVEIDLLKRKLARWRIGTFATGALAASLMVAVLVSDFATPVQDRQFVAVFHRDDTQPAFVMSIDLDTRAVIIRPVSATLPEGKTYQLWIASDELGPAPKSLGLLENASVPTTRSLGEFDPALLRNATFGISLEPEGGSPTGRPTGPAIHGRLIPVEH